jgi:hypothetical protein
MLQTCTVPSVGAASSGAAHPNTHGPDPRRSGAYVNLGRRARGILKYRGFLIPSKNEYKKSTDTEFSSKIGLNSLYSSVTYM